ncbi:MAG: family oxidoreductase [Panacagrimonas sp.]|jgi:short-subunit dehydrogenase|nr:SDR family oxidoreductase [Panacagrimonas sp.]MCC2658139.1 family oxidoreductase [Panacagrimonas sp.]
MNPFGCALVTGASGGIGEAFARRLAADGLDLMLVARSAEKLKTLARTLRKSCGIRVETLALDLAKPGAGPRVKLAVEEAEFKVDMLINNAGFGMVGSFHKLDPARTGEMVALNIGAVVDITHAFLPDMLAQGRGAILNIASMAAFQPTPYMTSYGATKAFVLSFSEGLWGEYRKRGIRVLAVCPGPVDTGFFDATGNPETRAGIPRRMMLKAERVVEESLDALARNKMIIVPGGMGQGLVAGLPRLAPRTWIAAGVAGVLGRSTGNGKKDS